MQTTATTSSRTWNATAYVMQDGAVIERRTHTITIERTSDTFTSATVDGQSSDLARAAQILVWAKATGTLEIVERREPSIGTRAAASLHRALARLGLSRNGSHYQVATEALERPVASLADLSPADAQTAYGYACAQVGISSRVWAA